LETARECVTTHLPKRTVPKMDGAQASAASNPLYAVPLRHRRTTDDFSDRTRSIGKKKKWGIALVDENFHAFQSHTWTSRAAVCRGTCAGLPFLTFLVAGHAHPEEQGEAVCSTDLGCSSGYSIGRRTFHAQWLRAGVGQVSVTTAVEYGSVGR